MYLPEHFRETDETAIRALIEAHPLACIIAQTDAGLIANHIPLLPGRAGQLIGHVALANDMHRMVADGQEVLAVFRGPDAYISPNDYPSKHATHRQVPTWNYQAVHVHGTITFQRDAHSGRAAVALLTRVHERRRNGPEAWRMSDAPEDYMVQMLRAIVAFRITVTRVTAKSKLSQNKEAHDIAGAISGLRDAREDTMAEAMERHGRRRE